MREDERVLALTAAMPSGTGLASLRREFGDRVIDVGIAESAAVDIAAGLAKVGLKPVVAIYSTFMQRAFDQVFQEISLQNLPVTICMDRAGVVGGDGAVHHGFCDIAIFRTLPNIIMMAAMNEAELAGALRFSIGLERACAIRYPRDTVLDNEAFGEDYACEPFEMGRASWVRRGKNIVILGFGSVVADAVKAANELSNRGYDIGVISARFVKPLDEHLIGELLSDDGTQLVLTVEDHALIGGFGAAVLELANERGWNSAKIKRLGMGDSFVGVDTRAGQLRQVGIDAEGIANSILESL